MAESPWAFGWTQLLTIVGMIITIGIAAGGFRTFGRWKREKLEEARIETAIKALALTYKSKFVFESIRSPMTFSFEYKDMPEQAGETEDKRGRRGSFYAILKRIEHHKAFFEQAWELQAECTAIFGPAIEDTFLLLHRARREIEVSAEMLWNDPEPTHRSEDNLATWNSFRADVWAAYAGASKDGDKVGAKLSKFRSQMESFCRPIIDRGK